MLKRLFKTNDERKPAESRRLRLETLEKRELLSVAPWETAADAASEAAVVASVESAPVVDLSSLAASEAVSADSTTSLVVTTTADAVDSYDGVTSLREAISVAPVGSTITFDASLREKRSR